ncbi:MAG TPA: peptidoglycan bridge formation glycyltransferase FemA/FemB family protein [Candidatus Dormibacteraeota bacterium]|jgi:lipid II:glycine glycyltransferase (peptidoglycan interpeptide bridge formation enzyme)|nr:peptidoglycan bridge formation glycyltransferase FemA/FemB family protein [Candidatus Dormibacteraeota bacterium]
MQDPPAAADLGRSWDGQLLTWPRPHLLQSWGWGELQAGAGWAVERSVVAGLPLTILRGGAGVPWLPPRLYVPKGPACDPGDAAAWSAVLEELEDTARRTGAVSVTVEPNAWYDEHGALQNALGAAWRPAATVQPEHTAVVDLRGGEEQVLQRMKPKGRYNIRLAARKGVTVETPSDPDRAAAELARLCAATAQRQGINLPGPGYFRRALDRLPTARIHLAVVEGEAVSGVLVAHFAGEMIYLYGGSEARHRERQPSSALHHHVIQEALAAGCDRYDLWGLAPSDDPSHPWHGLRQFKLALGGAERGTAGAFEHVRRPVAARTVAVANAARKAARHTRTRTIAFARSRAAVQSPPSPHPPGDS